MESIIMLAVLLIETGFASYCIITKSFQRKVEKILHIGAFPVLVILMLTPAIGWNFRWYGLAALVLIRAAFAAWTLMRTRFLNHEGETGKEYKTSGIVFRRVGMSMLIAMSLIPAMIFPEHEIVKITGEHPVGTVFYSYTDTDRIETYAESGENRKVNVAFWYPIDFSEEDFHTFPIVVFSHGSFGTKSSNESLYNELASQGYVVCSIDHTYHALFTTDKDGNTVWVDMGYMQEVRILDVHSNKQQALEFFQKWMEIRTSDINFVINRIIKQAENEAADTVYKLVDTSRIGVMGHSLGGSAALGIGRMRSDINAVIALESPFLYDIEGFEEGEFIFTDKAYPVPVLNVYSDASWSHLSEWAQYAENYLLLSDTEATAFNVYISGVGHLTLTDLALTSPFLTRVLNQQESPTDALYSLTMINKVCLEFFNSYLKGVGNFTSVGRY